MGTATSSKLEELRTLTENSCLNELREVTTKLESFSNIVDDTTRCVTEVIEGKLLRGTGIIFGLYKTEHVAISRVFISAGSIIDRHFHGEREIIGVMIGGMVVDSHDELKSTVRQYEIIELPPDKEHSIMAVEDTWLWVVTMPASKEFPNAPTNFK